jgi:DNA (cytosine-5)-methyltransferase 1
LFGGFGGMSLGAEEALVRILWAGNHDPNSVRVHELNHPGAKHACQDLQQADWTTLPRYDLLLAGPACQGHSEASQPKRREYHDKLRGTAWAVIDCAEATRPRAVVVENVPPFTRWVLFKPWTDALRHLGFHVQVVKLWATRYGVPQRRQRVFVVGTRRPVNLGLDERRPEVEPAFGSCLESTEEGWRPIAAAPPQAQQRMMRALANHGPLALSQHVTGHPGVSLAAPIRTITTAPQHWVLVDGRRGAPLYRHLTLRELARGQGFPDTFRWYGDMSIATVTRGIGNAVPPPLARAVVERVAQAA